ncbi:MAG: hypothetical protein OXP71_16340 [Candidatus Poribacteria bacterium]|nr:hypothetical protein [Candidatus Poribacteria bacterium]
MKITFTCLLSLALFGLLPSSFAQEPVILKHGDTVHSVAFSPRDSSLIASAGADNTIKLWNLRQNSVKTLGNHEGTVNSVAFSPDGKTLVSGSDDSTVKAWEISGWQEIASHEPVSFQVPFPVTEVTFAPDGQLIAAAGQHVILFDAVYQTEIATLPHGAWIWSASFSPNGRLLASGDHNGIVRIWNVQQRRIIAQLEGHSAAVGSLKFSPDSRTLVSGGNDDLINVWDVSNWERLGTIPNNGAVYSVDFSPDEDALAASGWEVSLWSIKNGEKIATLAESSDWVRTVAFSPDGSALASGGRDGTVRVRNIKTLLARQGPRYVVRLIYFLPSRRSPQRGINSNFDKLIRDVQKAYAGQMDYYGFGYKTFRLETDEAGKTVVHRLEGKFNDGHYHIDTWNRVLDEVDEHFDRSVNIYVAAIDIGSQRIGGSGSKVCGRGGPDGVFGGTVIVPASGDCFDHDVVVHELGHAFGLQHDFRNDLKPWIVLYSGDPMSTSSCAAEWLDAHRYFNTRRPFFNLPATFEMRPSFEVPPDAIRLRFDVHDSDGLHQAQLLTPEIEDSGGLIACQSLNGTNCTVEFAIPKSTLNKGGEVRLQVIDSHGYFSGKSFKVVP